jgi:hypothetical protein
VLIVVLILDGGVGMCDFYEFCRQYKKGSCEAREYEIYPTCLVRFNDKSWIVLLWVTEPACAHSGKNTFLDGLYADDNFADDRAEEIKNSPCYDDECEFKKEYKKIHPLDATPPTPGG